MITAALPVFGLLLLTPAPPAASGPALSNPETWKTLSGENRTSTQAESLLLDLLHISGTTTLSVAVVQVDRVVFDRTLGVVDRKTRKPADSWMRY